MQTLSNAWRAALAEDAAAVGRDDDAQLILRPFFYLTAVNARGARYVSPEIWTVQVDAEQALAGLRPDFDPVAAGWDAGQPVYGSDAWDDAAEWTLADLDAEAAA